MSRSDENSPGRRPRRQSSSNSFVTPPLPLASPFTTLTPPNQDVEGESRNGTDGQSGPRQQRASRTAADGACQAEDEQKPPERPSKDPEPECPPEKEECPPDHFEKVHKPCPDDHYEEVHKECPVPKKEGSFFSRFLSGTHPHREPEDATEKEDQCSEKEEEKKPDVHSEEKKSFGEWLSQWAQEEQDHCEKKKKEAELAKKRDECDEKESERKCTWFSSLFDDRPQEKATKRSWFGRSSSTCDEDRKKEPSQSPAKNERNDAKKSCGQENGQKEEQSKRSWFRKAEDGEKCDDNNGKSSNRGLFSFLNSSPSSHPRDCSCEVHRSQVDDDDSAECLFAYPETEDMDTACEESEPRASDSCLFNFPEDTDDDSCEEDEDEDLPTKYVILAPNCKETRDVENKKDDENGCTKPKKDVPSENLFSWFRRESCPDDERKGSDDECDNKEDAHAHNEQTEESECPCDDTETKTSWWQSWFN